MLKEFTIFTRGGKNDDLVKFIDGNGIHRSNINPEDGILASTYGYFAKKKQMKKFLKLALESDKDVRITVL